MLTTTKNVLRENFSHLSILLGRLCAPFGDRNGDDVITLTEILESNGLTDAVWTLKTAQEPESDRICKLMACDFVERVLDAYERVYPGDERPRKLVEVTRQVIEGGAVDRQKAMSVYWDAERAGRRANVVWERAYLNHCKGTDLDCSDASIQDLDSVYKAKVVTEAVMYVGSIVRNGMMGAASVVLAVHLSITRASAEEKEAQERIFREYMKGPVDERHNS